MATVDDKSGTATSRRPSMVAIASLRRMIWIRRLILLGAVLAQSACRDDKPAIAQRGTGDAFVAGPPNRTVSVSVEL